MLKSDGRDSITVLRLIGVQALATLLLGWLASGIKPEAAIACWVGGGIATAANSWMALVLFRPRAASSPESLLLSLYVGEVGKFLFVMAFFAIAFKRLAVLQLPANAMFMLMAFAAIQVLHWLWPLIEQKREISQTNTTADE